MKNPVVELHNVSKDFRNAETNPAVRNMTFVGHSGQVILLMGPSGSGKTTTLLLASGIIPASNGHILLLGHDLSALRGGSLQRIRALQVGIVFQDFRLIEELTVWENVFLAASFSGSSHAMSSEHSAQSLRRLGLLHLRNRRPRNLSHGERQRTALARAVVNNPSFIVADEPTASLDSNRAIETMSFLRTTADESGACLLVASHDSRLIPYSDTLIEMRDGAVARMQDCTSAQTLSTHNPTHGGIHENADIAPVADGRQSSFARPGRHTDGRPYQ